MLALGSLSIRPILAASNDISAAFGYLACRCATISQVLANTPTCSQSFQDKGACTCSTCRFRNVHADSGECMHVAL